MSAQQRTCPHCKGTNTRQRDVTRPGPGLFLTLMFGLEYLLVRFGCLPSRGFCHDCGTPFRYRTNASNFTLILLIAVLGLSLLIVLVWAVEG